MSDSPFRAWHQYFTTIYAYIQSETYIHLYTNVQITSFAKKDRIAPSMI